MQELDLSSGRTGPVVSSYGLIVFITLTLPPAGCCLKYIDTHSQKPPTGSNTHRDKILYQDRKSSLSPFKASKKHVTVYSIQAWRHIGWPMWPMTDVSVSAYMLPDMHQYEIVLCEIIMQKKMLEVCYYHQTETVRFTVSVSLWHYRHYLSTTLRKMCLNQPVYQHWPQKSSISRALHCLHWCGYWHVPQFYVITPVLEKCYP